MQRVSWYCHWPRRVSTDCSRRSFQSGIGQEHGLESLRIYSVICCINTFYTTDRCFWTCYKNKWKFLYTICISLATQSTVQSNVIFLLNITSLFSALLPTSPRQNMAIQLLQQHRCQTLSLLPNVITWHYYRAMHFSAKRGIAIACRLSVRLSVCLWRWWIVIT